MNIRVIDIWREVKKIVGNSDDAFIYQRLTDAVDLLSNKGDWDPLLATLDIVTEGRVITMPPEVETILGLSMCGRPAIARDEFFQFHLNGPGIPGWGNWGGSPYGPEIRYEWLDLNDKPTYRDIPQPDKLMAYCVEPADVGCEFWVGGFDRAGNLIRSQDEKGDWIDGWKVPVFQTLTALPSGAPYFSRVAWIRKPLTAGPIRLSTAGQVLLGVYQGNETAPAYRQIQLSRCVPWIRIRFRRRTFAVQSKYDLLPVLSTQSLLMMLRALRAYDSPEGLAQGEAFEATALRWATEKQFTANPPVAAPIQVLNSAPLQDAWDYME